MRRARPVVTVRASPWDGPFVQRRQASQTRPALWAEPLPSGASTQFRRQLLAEPCRRSTCGTVIGRLGATTGRSFRSWRAMAFRDRSSLRMPATPVAWRVQTDERSTRISPKASSLRDWSCLRLAASISASSPAPSSFYGGSLVAWTPAPAAAAYDIEWSRNRNTLESRWPTRRRSLLLRASAEAWHLVVSRARYQPTCLETRR